MRYATPPAQVWAIGMESSLALGPFVAARSDNESPSTCILVGHSPVAGLAVAAVAASMVHGRWTMWHETHIRMFSMMVRRAVKAFRGPLGLISFTAL